MADNIITPATQEMIKDIKDGNIVVGKAKTVEPATADTYGGIKIYASGGALYIETEEV